MLKLGIFLDACGIKCSKEQSVNKYVPPDEDDHRALSITAIVLIIVSSIILIAMIVYCIKYIREKRNETPFPDQLDPYSESINNNKQVNVSFSDMDREDTIRSTSSMAFKRYDTGGRTWIG